MNSSAARPGTRPGRRLARTLGLALTGVLALGTAVGVDAAVAAPLAQVVTSTTTPPAEPAPTDPSTTPPPETTEPSPAPDEDAVPAPDTTAPATTPPTTTPAPRPAPSLVAPPPAAPADPRAFVCWGDSLSYHVCGPGEGGYLQNALGSGRTVLNRAVGGQTSSEIAIRMGAYAPTITFPSNTIPASGTVQVEVGNLPNDVSIFVSRVTVNGVEGVLRRTRGMFPVWQFERAVAGAAVPTPARAPITVTDSMDRNHPGMIWAGRNNVQQPDRIIADVAAMVAVHRATSTAPLWVVGMTPSKSEPAGTAEAGWIARVNATLAATYGDSYIPMDDYLRDQALRDLGIAPTSADRAAVAKGVLPPSLTVADGMHFNHAGRTAIAQYIARIVQNPEDDYLRNFDPQGAQAFVLDGATGTLQVVGWAFDKSDVYANLTVTVSVNGAAATSATANRPSPNLASYGVPGNHAYWTALQLGRGPNEVCVTVRNLQAGRDLQLPCRTFDVSPPVDRSSPQGDTSIIPDPGNGRVTVVGWAFDHSHLYNAIDIRVTVNGASAGTVRAQLPADYLRAYGVPGNHGFVGSFEVPAGTSRVCVTALDIAPGRDTVLGCSTVTAPAQDPQGSANVEVNPDGTVSVTGWAFDRSNFYQGVDIAIFQNGTLTTMRAATAGSPQLAQYGVPGNHGIAMRVDPITRGDAYDFCVLAVNIGRGSSQWLGCWHLDSRAVSPLMAWTVSASTEGVLGVEGWAFDSSNQLRPVPFSVTVDGVTQAVGSANLRRSELATIFGWAGDHGFVAYMSRTTPGTHRVCVTGHNIGATAASTTQCQNVTVTG